MQFNFFKSSSVTARRKATSEGKSNEEDPEFILDDDLVKVELKEEDGSDQDSNPEEENEPKRKKRNANFSKLENAVIIFFLLKSLFPEFFIQWTSNWLENNCGIFIQDRRKSAKNSRKIGHERVAGKSEESSRVDPGFVYDGVRDSTLKHQCTECLYATNTLRSFHIHMKR